MKYLILGLLLAFNIMSFASYLKVSVEQKITFNDCAREQVSHGVPRANVSCAKPVEEAGQGAFLILLIIIGAVMMALDADDNRDSRKLVRKALRADTNRRTTDRRRAR